MMERIPLEVGRVAESLQGRDRGRYFVILQILDEQYVLLADGDTRKLAHPKKKKVKHLHAKPALVPGIAEGLESRRLLDSDLRKALSAAGYGIEQPNKEG